MNIKVCKFGGTSCADASTFRRIKDIIESDSERRYVVVSAPGKRDKNDIKVTDLLFRAVAEFAYDNLSLPSLWAAYDRFLSLKRDLNLSLDLKAEFDAIKTNILKGASSDYIVSRGEYLTAKLCAEFLGYEFVDASELIKFCSTQYDEELTNTVTAHRLSGVERAVVPGFYGVDALGAIKTLGRGGSDVTGAIIARALSAEVYENWTDVSGFMACDPRIVLNPIKMEMLTYKELRELSYMGANVLHPESIFPVRKADIPINIKNTFEPNDVGTMIVPTKRYLQNEFERDERTITGIAGKKDFISINLAKSMLNNETGTVAKILALLAPHNISFEHMPTGIDTISIVIDSHNMDMECLPVVLRDIERVICPDYLEVDYDLALIAIVGHEMIKRKGTAARILTEVAKANVNVKMIDAGSSQMNIIIGVQNNEFEKAIEAIYRLI